MLPALTLGALLWGTSAHATAPDVFGIGGRWQGAGGGGVAIVEDGTAAHLNPAGLARIRRPTAGFGFTSAYPKFRELPDLWWDTNRDGVLDARDPPLQWSAQVPPHHGLSVFVGRHIGERFGFGITAYVPTRNLIRFATFEPSLPNYIMWSNRLERFVATAGLGGELLPGLSLGIGVDTLAAARFHVHMTANAVISAGEEGSGSGDVLSDMVIDVHELQLALVPAFAPIAGLQFDVGEHIPALEGLVLGAALHGSVGLPIEVELDMQANATLQDVGDLEPYVAATIARATLQLFDHYVPPRQTFGLAYRRGETLAVYADLRRTDWRKMTLNVARLTQSELILPLIEVDDVLRDGNAHQVLLRATLGLRMGTELTTPALPLDSPLRYVQLSFRGGVNLEPSPLIGQGTQSNLLDAHRSVLALGAGVETWDPFKLTDGAVRIDLFFQYHMLAHASLPRQTDIPRPGYPRTASALPMGGNIPVFGGQLSLEY